MFTEKQMSEMFRMGTLNGKPIERSKETIENKIGSQIKSVVVIIDGERYIIKRVYNVNENKSIDIIVHYSIEKQAG